MSIYKPSRLYNEYLGPTNKLYAMYDLHRLDDTIKSIEKKNEYLVKNEYHDTNPHGRMRKIRMIEGFRNRRCEYIKIIVIILALLFLMR